MKKTISLIALGTLLVTSSHADEVVDEIVVSALRRDVSPVDVAVAISSTEPQSLAAAAVLTDGLLDVPGVYLQQTTPGQGAIVLRGQLGSSVLHAVDGVRLNNTIFKDAPTPWLSLVPVAAVERVEVMRGSGASLYGSDAIGGVVNVVTHRPRFSESRISSTGDVHFGHGSANAGESLRARVDIGNERFAASLAAEHASYGDRRIGGGATLTPTAFDSRGARLALAYAPADRGDWLLDLQFYEQPQTPRIDELIPGYGQTEPSAAEFFYAPNRRRFVHLQHRRPDGVAGADWQVDLSWQRIDDDRVTRALNSTERRIETNSSDLFAASITTNFDRGAVAWTAGLDTSLDRVRSQRWSLDIDSGSEATLAARFPDGAEQTMLAAFINGGADLGQSLSLNAGLRVTAARVELPASPLIERTIIDGTDWSADIGAVWQLGSRWQLVASVARGFRSPNVFDLGSLGPRPGNRFNVPNTALDSEQALQADFGVRYRTGPVAVTAQLYTLAISGRILSLPTGELTADGRSIVRSENARRSNINGIELALDASFASGIQLAASIDYTHGTNRTGATSQPADRIPPLSGRLLIDWDAGGPFAAQARVRAAGAQSRLSERDRNDPRIDPTGTPGWVTFDATAYWRFRSGWTLGVGVDNLSDLRYRWHGSGLDAPGRSYTLLARYAW